MVSAHTTRINGCRSFSGVNMKRVQVWGIGLMGACALSMGVGISTVVANSGDATSPTAMAKQTDSTAAQVVRTPAATDASTEDQRIARQLVEQLLGHDLSASDRAKLNELRAVLAE